MIVKSSLRVGIAGYGVVGKRRRHYIDLHPVMKTVAVSDRTYNGSGLLPDGIAFCDDYKDLLDHKLDVLFVCLSNDVAAAATIGGLERGYHVFCEKPPGRNVDEMMWVLNCHKDHPKLRLKYGFNHRYHDSIRDALGLVESGELGQVINLRGVYGKSKLISFDRKSDWRTQREIAGGGILLDQGIHMVDLIRSFGGEFEIIHSIISNDFWKHNVEDNAYALMRSESGVVAMLHSSATQWRHRFELDITLEKGSIGLSGILSSTKSYGSETLTVARPRDDDRGDPFEETRRYNQDKSWESEIAEFYNAVANDEPIVHGSPEEALKTMELVYRIYCADEEWRRCWNLSFERSPISSH